MNKINKLKESALAGAEWLVKSQNRDTDSADHGRFMYALELETGEFCRSRGWQTGFAVIALLSAFRVRPDERYKEAATHAMRYLQSLQILDSRNRAHFGAIREETPQTEWSHPRDAVSVAWSMLAYSEMFDDADLLDRAKIFADWLLDYAFFNDWIPATVKLGSTGRDSDDVEGSFQSGTILFFLELYQATHNLRYLEAGRVMAQRYIKDFISAEGEIQVMRYRNIGGTPDPERWGQDWLSMHRVNDDFGGIAMVEAFRRFEDPVYAQRCSSYLKWLEAHVNQDGSYLNPTVEVGSATASIFLFSYREIAPAEEIKRIDQLIERNLSYLRSIQQTHTKDPYIEGAFLGMDSACQYGHGKYINIRCTTYAIIALCRALGKSWFPLSMVEPNESSA